MGINFPLVLVLATLITGLVWLLDIVLYFLLNHDYLHTHLL